MPPEAAQRIRRAAALYDRGHHEGALTQYRAAYEVMEGDPRQHQVLYNIALCYERVFRYDDAIRYYERFLEDGGADGPLAAEVRAILEALQQLLGSVEILSTVEGFEVWIDDHYVGNSAAVIRVPAGTHTIELRAARHFPARREVAVRAGAVVRVDIPLESVDAFRGLPQAVFWSSAGVTIAALVAGIGVGIESLIDGRELELRLASDPEMWSVTDGEIAALQRLSLAADVLFGLAGLFGVATLVLAFVTDWRGDVERPAGQATVAASPSGIEVFF
jgi:hypothetical protein